MSNVKVVETFDAPAIIISEQDTVAMRDAGAAAVSSTYAATAILKASGIDNRKSELCLAYQTLFYEGGLMRAFSWDLTEARRQLGLDGSTNSKTKGTDKARTEIVDRVYGTLKTQWSRACDDAALPKQHAGGNRGTSDSKVQGNATDAPVTVEAFHVPTGLDTSAAVELFAKLHDAMARVINANSATVTGDAGSVLRQWVQDGADYLSDARKALDADTVKPAPVLSADELRAQIIAELKAEGMLKGSRKAKVAKAA